MHNCRVTERNASTGRLHLHSTCPLRGLPWALDREWRGSEPLPLVPWDASCLLHNHVLEWCSVIWGTQEWKISKQQRTVGVGFCSECGNSWPAFAEGSREAFTAICETGWMELPLAPERCYLNQPRHTWQRRDSRPSNYCCTPRLKTGSPFPLQLPSR